MSQSPSDATSRKSAHWWAALLILILEAPSLVWIVRDRSVWPWDQAWYGEVSTDLWFSLSHLKLLWANQMLNELSMKPPGVSWIGQFFVPVYRFLGSIEASLLLSIVLSQAVVLGLLYLIGRAMFPASRVVPAAAVVFAAGGQLFVGLTHEFFVEPLQSVAVAWAFLIAARCRDWPRARVLIHLTAAFILGLAAKTTTPLYCGLPLVYSLVAAVRRPGDAGFRDEWKFRGSRLLAVGAVVMGMATLIWYVHNFGPMIEHIRFSSSGAEAVRYGFRADFFTKFVTWTKLTIQAFLAPYDSWALAAAIVLGFGGFVWKRPSVPVRSAVALMAAAQILIVLAAFSRADAVEPRYLLALSPCLAIVVLWLSGLPGVPAIAWAVFAIGLCQWGVVNQAAMATDLRLQNQSAWLHLMHPDPEQFHELERVVEVTADEPGRYNVIGLELPWFNANSASFFVAKRQIRTGFRVYYTSLGYAQADVKAALQRLDDLKTKYFITYSEPFQPKDPDFLNTVAAPVLRNIQSNSHYMPVPFLSHEGVVIYRRLD